MKKVKESTDYDNLIGDIQLSLQTVHKKEHIISDFSDTDDMDFADCY